MWRSSLVTVKQSPTRPLGLLFSIVGGALIYVGFFLPLVFWQSIGAISIDGQESQWDMVRYSTSNFSNTWLLWIAFVLPLLAAPGALVMRGVPAIMRREISGLARWDHYIILSSALLEFLFAPFVFFLSGILGAKIFPGPGLILPLLGSIFLLIGLYLEYKR